MKKKTSKIIYILMIMMLFIQNISGIVMAATEISKANLKNDHKITTNIQYFNQDGTWHNIQCHYIAYTHDGKKYPAYCIKHGVDGVDEAGSYTVKISELLSDEKIWRTIINGYPYKTPEQLGVETADDAYVATKQAVNSVMLNRDVKKFYRGKNNKGKKIVDAIYNISQIGKYGTQKMQDANLKITKEKNLTKYNDDWYYQEYSITSDVAISEYVVDSISNFPEGSYISDLQGNGKWQFTAGEKFRIMMKKENIKTDFTGSVHIKGKCKTYPIFFGEAPNSKVQDYAITYDAYGDFEANQKSLETTNNASIQVIKKDEETSHPVKNVKYQLTSSDGKVVDLKTTNEEGKINFEKLYPGKYLLQEVKENDDYIIDNTKYEIQIGYNETITKTLTNKHKKGNLKIIKVDKDDNDITLGGIEFDLINENKEVVVHLTTNADGEAYIENINTGNYILKETKTKKEYNLCVDEDIVVKWNETSKLIIENEKKKGQIQVIKEDADYHQIKLEGVEFEVLDKNNRIIEKITTNKNGEAITSKLPIGEYKIREISLGNNTNYLLTNEMHIIKVENDKVSSIILKNEHQKGNLKILKVDKDNTNIPIANVKFEVTDKDGFKYYATTNENGIAQIDNIRTGKIKIKEIETRKEYVLMQEEKTLEIKYKKTSEIMLENEKKKGQIEVYKTDEENNQIKIQGVEFEVLNADGKVVDKIVTNKDGYAISKKLPIGEYTLKEIKTDEKYTLNDEKIKVEVKYNENTSLHITNQKIKGKIQIVKISSKDSPILGIKQGEKLPNVKFEIYNDKNELVDTLLTDVNGQALSKDLEIGRYKIKEVSTLEYYLLNTNEFFANIKRNNEIQTIKIENEPAIPKLDIEKTGPQEAYQNDEIKYDFQIKNGGNVELSDFTWTEYIPYEQVKLTKMITGMYNENLNYQIFYKTNQENYKLLKVVNTTTSEYIDFSNIPLKKREMITEIKVDYGTVSVGFKTIVKPSIVVKINNNVNKNETIINKTELRGNTNGYNLTDNDTCETIVRERKIEKKLPRTGK